MDFSLTETQRAVRQTFKDFAEREVRPVAADLDRNPRFPTDLFARLGHLGFFGMRYPEPLGGGADIFAYLLAVEELARASLSVAAVATMQSLMGTYFLHRFGDERLKRRVLAPALAGDLVATICMTEPNAGSDLLAMTTKAAERDGTWHLDGQKTWITSAPVADVFTVLARTGDKELSVFLVERGAPGLSVGRAIEKMGVRAALTSEVFLDSAPASCMLGPRGAGTEGLREVLAEIRLVTATLALGAGQAAFDDSLAYAKQRMQFGKPIASIGAIQAHLAEMATRLAAARQLINWAAWRSHQGEENADQAAMAKLFASEVATEVCDRAARIMASYGYASEYPIERYLRDVRFTLIGGGTSEVLAINIARGLTR
ncbi:MAG: Acyl-CoA dehydrogenase [Gemmatimonadaceae bacterium]|nr:Acyl-CoA dehydrogenase [Gemmatimonadaceae bacterium]